MQFSFPYSINRPTISLHFLVMNLLSCDFIIFSETWPKTSHVHFKAKYVATQYGCVRWIVMSGFCCTFDVQQQDDLPYMEESDVWVHVCAEGRL